MKTCREKLLHRLTKILNPVLTFLHYAFQFTCSPLGWWFWMVIIMTFGVGWILLDSIIIGFSIAGIITMGILVIGACDDPG